MHFKTFLTAASIALASVTAGAAERLTFQLDWLPNGDKAFAYVALKQGFYAAEGLDVSVVPGRGSSDAITKVATGAADVCNGAIASLMMAAAESPVPVKAVMSVYSVQPDALFTIAGSGVNELKDLTGKTVAMPTFSSSNVLWPVILRANGIDPGKVKTVKVDPSAQAPMLAQGRVDATINWTTVVPQFDEALKQANKKLSVIEWSKYGLDGYGMSIFASDKLIRERPEVLAKFLRATAKAIRFSIENPDKAAADLKAAVPETDIKVAAAMFRASIPLIDNPISKRDGFGAFEPKPLEATWTWVYRSMNYPADKVRPESLVDRSFLPKLGR
ncbi:ABC transporter substrate-binding protein [Variovorax atrisoli]|uniref:ABC transporter substrate-binding protein n=1 Tax=Variovorax atrisoli TaxID=3394203 RepID=UPI00039B521A|nr:ABC transporter substrate-binding protein [Variovorax paradoxus]